MSAYLLKLDFTDPEITDQWNLATHCPHLPIAGFPEFAKDRSNPACVPLAQVVIVDLHRAAVFWHRSGELHLRCATIELVLLNELERARFEPKVLVALVEIAQLPQIFKLISSRGRRVNPEADLIRPKKKH